MGLCRDEQSSGHSVRPRPDKKQTFARQGAFLGLDFDFSTMATTGCVTFWARERLLTKNQADDPRGQTDRPEHPCSTSWKAECLDELVVVDNEPSRTDSTVDPVEF